MSAAERPSEEAVIAALGSQPDVTAADLSAATGLGRSTVGKLMPRLERAGRVHRSAGGREGGRRLPNRWTLADGRKATRRRSRGKRLHPGELDGLVLDYLAKHKQSGPLSPAAVANDLGRSAGAVGNCLARLAAAGRVRQVSQRPRRYSLA